MIPALRRDEVNSTSNPKLVFAAIDPGNDGGGILRDVDTLEFQVFNTSVFPAVQVFPGSGRHIVDLVADRLSPGRYAAAYTVATAEALGAHEVRWYVVREDGGDEELLVQRFSVVVATENVPRAYATVADMRAEGVPTTSVLTDARLSAALEQASRYIESITRRWFEPRYMTMDIDGVGGPMLLLDIPVIAIESIAYTFASFTQEDSPLFEGEVRVYNRHIRNGLLSPDDRENPKIELLRVDEFVRGLSDVYDDTDILSSASVGFVRSQQNVRLTGIFGYTDPDGSPMGATPELIRELTMRIAMRRVVPLWSSAGHGGPAAAGSITAERTRDQSVSYSSGSNTTNPTLGHFTGDPEIDQLLAQFSAPPGMSGV